MAKVITRDTTIGEVLDADIETSTVLAGIGMFCFGCPSAQNETIAEAAELHGVDADELVAALQEKIAEGAKV